MLKSLEKIAGLNTYGWYGGGGHQTPGAPPIVLTVQGTDIVNSVGKWVSTIRATHNFKNHRMFIDSWIIVPETTSTNQNFTIKMNPTEQGFYFDDFFRLQIANGITPILCPTGLFDWLKVAGYSQRKSAPFDHSKDPSDPAAWADFAHLFYLLAKHLKEQGIDAVLQTGNEKDFRWNVQRILRAREWAVGDWECIKAIRKANPDQKIMMGSTLTPTIEVFEEYISTLKQLAGSEWDNVKGKIVYTFSHYVRNLGGNQGAGECDTPENQWAQTFEFYTKLNQRCEQEGIEWSPCEWGFSTSTSTSVSAKKQKAPALQGISHEEAQGVLLWRSLLMFASFSKCYVATLYHCRDGYEAEPFTYIGVNYHKDFNTQGKQTWDSKPGKLYFEAQLAQYGKFTVESFTRANGIYYAKLSNGQTLHWTDKTNIGNVTPMPKLTTGTVPPPPPPPPTNNDVMIKLSYNADRSNAVELTAGLKVKPGNIYIFADKSGTLSLRKDGVLVRPPQTENVAPYDLGGSSPDGSTAKPVAVTVGNYEFEFAGVKIPFTVADEVTPPPPPPPPTTKPLVTVNVSAPPEVDIKVSVNGVIQPTHTPDIGIGGASTINLGTAT